MIRVVVVLVALAVPACPSDPGAAPPDAGELSAGDDLDGGPRSPGDAACDGGDCAAYGSDACRALRRDACGDDDGAGDDARCATTPACTAAELLSTYEPASCAAAVADDVRFPDCTDTTCALLVARVCGAAPPAADAACADAPGCPPALQLWRRSIGVDAGGDPADALASCGDALTDEDVFAPCGG